MAKNNVSIKVGTNLSGIEQDAKKLKSALDGAARGGIAGFEAAQQKVIDLTKRMAELRAEILKTDDPAQLKKLQGALGETRQRFQAARTELRGMTLEQRDATEKAQLLAGQLGVHLPAGLDRLIARMPGVQAALQAAFSLTIVGAFA